MTTYNPYNQSVLHIPETKKQESPEQQGGTTKESQGNILKESLVYAKTKCEQLDAVVHLNLWGSHLSDVSLISKMSNVEIVSLSVNQISSLEPFSYCSKLSELYLRKNKIHDVEEVVYLKDLKNLRLLWLSIE